MDTTSGITPRYLTPQEAATYTGASIATVRRWMASGKLHVYRCGKRFVRLDKNEIDAFLHKGGA